MFKHLLVATDGSALSDAAVVKAISFAQDVNAHITFVHVEQPVPAIMYGEGVPAQSSEDLARATDNEAKSILGRCESLARQSGVDCDLRAEVNRAPYEAIIGVADTAACDVIFMASHGRRGLSAFCSARRRKKCSPTRRFRCWCTAERAQRPLHQFLMKVV